MKFWRVHRYDPGAKNDAGPLLAELADNWFTKAQATKVARCIANEVIVPVTLTEPGKRTSALVHRNPTLFHHGATPARFHVITTVTQSPVADLWTSGPRAKRVAQSLANMIGAQVSLLDNEGTPKGFPSGHRIVSAPTPRKRNPRSRGEVDPDAARELELFIENDADLYRQQHIPILQNLWRKMVKGTYDHEKAVKLWGYLVESGAKKYAREFDAPGASWHAVFNIPTREAVARSLAETGRRALENREYSLTWQGEKGVVKKNPSRSLRARFSRYERRHAPRGLRGSGSRRTLRALRSGRLAKAHYHQLSTLDRGRFRKPNPRHGSKLPGHWWESTEIETWFERDRQHVELRWADDGETIMEWWDEDVTQAVEDGFLDPRDYHGSALEYAHDLGVLQASARERRTQRGVERGRARRNPSRSKSARARRKYARSMYEGQGQRRIAARYKRARTRTAQDSALAQIRHMQASGDARYRRRRTNPRVRDLGAFVAVSMSARDVQDFKSRWPASGLPSRSVTFHFDKRNGDLVDITPAAASRAFDNEAAVALSQDAWEHYAQKKNPGLRRSGPRKTAYFERFSITLPLEAVEDMSGPGQADEAVEYWSRQIIRPRQMTKDALRAELKEYGAWDAEQLDDDAQNWQRILWIAAGNIREEGRQGNPRGRQLSVPDQHLLKIARRTLQMNDTFARIMGGPTKEEAREIIRRLTGREPKENNRGRRVRARRRNPSMGAARARRTFRMWHGFDSRRIVRLKGPDRQIPGTLVKLGDVPEFVYRSNKWDGGKPVTYSHKTKRPYPVLATDPAGRYLYLIGGKTKVTADGLVH